MHPKIKIAIIIIHYGDISVSLRCLKSLMKWATQPYTLYLIDHDPQQAELLKAELIGTGVRYLRPNQNLGFAGGCNLGAKIALEEGAEAVLFLNNDAWIDQDILSVFRQGHEQYQGRCALTGLIYEADGKIWFSGGHFSKSWMRLRHFQVKNNQERQLQFVSGCLMYLPAQIFQKLRGFDEQFFLYWEDLDLSLRAIAQGIPLVFMPDVLVFHDVSQSTGRNSQLTRYFQNRNRWIILKKHGHLGHWFCFIPIYLLGVLKRSLRQPSSCKFEWRLLWDGLRFRTGKGMFQELLERDRGDKLPVTLEVDATL